jgi:hypothetical protein
VMSVTISGTGSITGAGLNKKIEAFTASGTWTVPAGVTYAIAHMLGGGGGIGQSATGGNGGASSVAFSGGTVTANGANHGGGYSSWSATHMEAGAANTGNGARGWLTGGADNSGTSGGDAQYVVAGDAVTPAASITVTVGTGGAAGTSGVAGGSGYVYIEYYAD